MNDLGGVGTGIEFDWPVTINFSERVFLGDNIYVGPNSVLDGRGGLEIRDHTIISAEVRIMTSMHRFQHAKLLPYDEVELLRSVKIGMGVWIGVRAMVLPGVVLGDGCIVGAGAVVARSWEDGSIVVGNPARLVRKRDMAEFRRLAGDGQWYLLTKRSKGLVKVEQRELEHQERSDE
jgi:maltose O-acetyltransferase